jgi:hypothetical protein
MPRVRIAAIGAAQRRRARADSDLESIWGSYRLV